MNLTWGDDQATANATVHFPCGSTHAAAETAAQCVSPGDDGMLGPLLEFSRSKCPSLKKVKVAMRTLYSAQKELLPQKFYPIWTDAGLVSRQIKSKHDNGPSNQG